MKAWSISYHGVICLLALPTPHPTTCPCPYPPQVEGPEPPYILYLYLHHLINYHQCTPWFPFLTTITCCCSHATLPMPSTIASRMPSPAFNSLSLSDHHSKPEYEIDPFLHQWQISIQTINHHDLWSMISFTFLISSWLTPRRHPRGLPRGKVKAMQLHNLTCSLYLIVSAFHTMMHGHIGPTFTLLLQYPIEYGWYKWPNS